MTSTPLNPCSELSEAEILEALETAGSINKAAIYLNTSRTRLQDRVKEIRGKFAALSMPAPIKLKSDNSGIQYWIFSSAQDRTKVHEPFLKNLEVYAEHLDADIHIGGFTYMVSNADVWEKGSLKDVLFEPSIKKYMTNRQHHVGDDIIFCGEQNTLPTAVNPLSGFETYTRDKWGIFPHPRVTLQSVPTMLRKPAKMNMTTGCVTLPNYIQKKAGIKAEFHHVIGAVLVAIDEDGDFFCRQLIADDSGGFYDLDKYIGGGEIFHGSRVEAITWGDVHRKQLCPYVAVGAWGYDTDTGEINKNAYPNSMAGVLQPFHGFYHDVSDFRARNHHDIKNCHSRFALHLQEEEDVEEEMVEVSQFLEAVQVSNCLNYVVEANHDLALERWLREADYREDPANALFFLRTQLKKYTAISMHLENYILLEDVLRDYYNLEKTVFLSEKDSKVICGNIENSLHGHSGANGARATPKSFSRMGSKANTAHTHTAGIVEGIWTCGTSSKLIMNYNKQGLSSWSNSHIVTHQNGKRQMITMQGMKWREGTLR